MLPRTTEELARLSDAFDTDLIIDAVLGTGFKPPMKGLALDALYWVLGSKAPVLSVDLPSGWPADSTDFLAGTAVFPSDAVITFTAPKPAHVFGNLTRSWDQPVVVAPIGSPDEAIVSALKLEWAGSAMSLVQAPRAVDWNKGKYGHVLVVGGTFGSAGGKAGAPAMTALGALRIGAGLVTAAVPVAGHGRGECDCSGADDLGLGGERRRRNFRRQSLRQRRSPRYLQARRCWPLGRALGSCRRRSASRWICLLHEDIPAVIDADALNILAKTPESIAQLAKGRSIVLTPHPGEMARLTGMKIAEIQANRVETARTFAQRNGRDAGAERRSHAHCAS